MVGNIIKIDLKTDKGARGQFARFAVQIDLRKSFISKIKIGSRIHKVEYESLPIVFFGYGIFRQLKGDYPQPKIMENMEKRLGEAEDPIRLDQHENTVSIQERIENEKFWQVNKKAMGGLRMKNEGGGIEKTGTSSETLKIGPNVGSGQSKFATNGDVENIDGLVGMVPVRKTIQGMVDRLE
ncbi:hypothetical protein Gorai_008922, partial [Gossypium raimondii]|nr:hypothetical protein [Gossypium raimondii]